MTDEPETPLPAEITEKDLEVPEAEDEFQSGYIPEQDSAPPKTLNLRLVTQPYDFVIDAIIAQIDNKTLILDPPYQRNYVWDNSRASQLIESLLINIPIPACYFAEDETGTYTLVDGQQRLRSIWRYLKGEFKLQGLGTLYDREGKLFQELSERDQRLIRGRTIRCIVITQESHPEIRFEVFKRLNRRPMPLSDQEIRNAIYRGDFNDLIKNLAEQPRWLKALNKKRLDKRMRDDELVVRFFAMQDNYKSYE